MTESIVINTGPLITIQRIAAVDIVGGLPFQFVCPQEVIDELDDGVRAGHPPVAASWLRVAPLREKLSRFLPSSLDSGEAAVIQLAFELNISCVCIDEWKGGRAALACGLEVTGVLGLLGRAKRLGIIKELKPFVQKALDSGIRYDDELVKNVFHSVGENML